MDDEEKTPLITPKGPEKKLIPASCNLCSYYSPNLADPNGNGVCRRKPPTVYPMPQGLLTVWPTVKPLDWCGEGDPGISHDTKRAGELLLEKRGNGHNH